ncbi:hypothetical protein VFPPC_17887 [Pochonia chlamydosporia 170]|uniref:Uncharacterized protein n=1 Tax=Pochonia chlamydosporia 170 TaxID=1380566 RepID=A0A219AQ53_METCM|nr:hypothetical protein VFPPC_17887 [Pochonia chlamydosporia 170]OWT42920.1 hypothetical protein VFPPC_17887 [Pochonia chlamydosporia 170]
MRHFPPTAAERSKRTAVVAVVEASLTIRYCCEGYHDQRQACMYYVPCTFSTSLQVRLGKAEELVIVIASDEI